MKKLSQSIDVIWNIAVAIASAWQGSTNCGESCFRTLKSARIALYQANVGYALRLTASDDKRLM
jgi:hypothetical protein